MYKSQSFRSDLLPRSNLSVARSQIISQPNKYEPWATRIDPRTKSIDQFDNYSTLSTQWMRHNESFYNESSSNLLRNNITARQLTKEHNKTLNNGTNCPFSVVTALLVLFSVISLAAIAMGIYTIIFVQMAFQTTTSTTTTTTTTTTTSSGPLYRWNTSGITIAGITGSAGSATTQLNGPYGLVVDKSGTVYVAEWLGHRVSRWAVGSSVCTVVAGQASGVASPAANYLDNPAHVIIDENGNLYVADALNHRVQFWAFGATTGTTVAGITGSPGALINQLNTPYSVARDSVRHILYIADTLNHRVMRYFAGATSGTVVAGGAGAGVASTQLYTPTSITFDASSNSLIIVNYQANNVVRWVIGASMWTPLAGSPLGIGGNSPMLLQGPVDAILDSMGNLYVADSANNRIQLFFAGHVNGTTIAGLSAGSGPTQLVGPYGVALDDDRNLYVSDMLNHRIQKFIRY